MSHVQNILAWYRIIVIMHVHSAAGQALRSVNTNIATPPIKMLLPVQSQ
jgi:hypothetical protein